MRTDTPHAVRTLLGTAGLAALCLFVTSCGGSQAGVDASLGDLTTSATSDATAALDLGSVDLSAPDLATPDLVAAMDLSTVADLVAVPDTLVFACSGTPVGGFCWYKGSVSESCTTVCGVHGGYNAATASYAGATSANDRTNSANCASIITAFAAKAYTTSVDNVNDTNDYGCVEEAGKNRSELVSLNPTTAGNGNALLSRFCACNN